jgi:hypothetical protein
MSWLPFGSVSLDALFGGIVDSGLAILRGLTRWAVVDYEQQ